MTKKKYIYIEREGSKKSQRKIGREGGGRRRESDTKKRIAFHGLNSFLPLSLPFIFFFCSRFVTAPLSLSLSPSSLLLYSQRAVKINALKKKAPRSSAGGAISHRSPPPLLPSPAPASLPPPASATTTTAKKEKN